ncbi:MAG: ABC transporter ATP-binding protein [Alphaproteobacteria bacterium]|nr:ABC transporter ATP-binding protein [Alphaproteobacteria bacterium]
MTDAPGANGAEPLLAVEGLHVAFHGPDGAVEVLNGVDFALARGEVLCLLGESGSGKSVTLRTILRLHNPKRTRVSGAVRFAGQDVLGLGERAMSQLRGGDIALIFQEPATAFDPVYSVGRQIVETIRRHKSVSEAAAWARAVELFQRVQIPSPERRLRAYPHELSGGMRQRAMIALALSCNPSLLLADEPTTALDATVQIQILLLLRRLQQEYGLSVIFVSHDIGVATEIADRIAVMYAGRIVEMGPVREVIRAPLHPYTQGLLGSTVRKGMRARRLNAIPGAPPNLAALPPGCSFAPRCPHAEPRCTAAVPEPIAPAPGQLVRCIRAPLA